jgi:hypothetical protein
VQSSHFQRRVAQVVVVQVPDLDERFPAHF